MSQHPSSILTYLNSTSVEKFEKIPRVPIYKNNSMKIIARWSKKYDPSIRTIPYWFGLKAVDIERIQTYEIMYYAFVCEKAGVIFLPIDDVLFRLNNNELLKTPLDGSLQHYHIQFDDKKGIMEWYLKNGLRINVNTYFYPISGKDKFGNSPFITLHEFEVEQKKLEKK
jgi:hypothetical protein